MQICNFIIVLIPFLVQRAFAIGPVPQDPEFERLVLNAHNVERAKHGVPPLTWDSSRALYAQRWSSNCEFQHSGGPYGENLYGITTSASTINYTASTNKAIETSWYGEIVKYNYNNPGFSEATGHFTQVVWRDTKVVGCAWNRYECPSGNNRFFMFTCEYSPPGNIVGGTSFQQNVPPPIQAKRNSRTGTGRM